MTIYLTFKFRYIKTYYLCLFLVKTPILYKSPLMCNQIEMFTSVQFNNMSVMFQAVLRIIHVFMSFDVDGFHY